MSATVFIESVLNRPHWPGSKWCLSASSAALRSWLVCLRPRSDPNYRDVVLEGRLRQALVRLNPDLPPEALDDAFRKLTRADAPSLIERNRAAPPDAGGRRDGRVPPRGRLDRRARRRA